ncbi:MAG: GNAT family N-acetyltransferase, partial [Desulfatiglandales bacterium]
MATETFRPDEKHVAEQVLRESLRSPSPEGYISLVADLKGKLVGWISFGMIPCTLGSWDLYWIVVSRAHRNKSIGSSLLNEAERIMARERGRMIWIETSSTLPYL